jgi:hypothetical protein
VLALKRFASLSGTRHTMTLRPPRRLLGRPTHGFGLRLTAVATDASGRRASTTRTLRVTVPRRR